MTITEMPAAELSTSILLRVGLLGQVGRFSLGDVGGLRRGERVVCRTRRGIEVAVALGGARESHDGSIGDSDGSVERDGHVLRRTTPEDELLWGHLRQLGEEAFQSCVAWLQEQSVTTTLLEVEPLLDGRTLYFHFLSNVEDTVQQQLDALVAIYENRVRESKFAKLLEHGCGPGCGTAKAKNGCGSRGGCAVCKVAAACTK
ncbi:MAG: hypothetical protein R3C09_00425 [Pirellulaceae bacterium]